MALTLLAKWALAAGALLVVPILIHLFKPRRVRQTPFSSLRWLHLTPQKLSRRIQWHQVLLFLLRAGFIVLLVLALARPLLTTGGESGSRERFIVLDVSHSMSYRASGQAPPIERARELAAELVRRNRPGDRTAILLTGSQTRLLTPLSREPENFLPALAKVQGSLTETDLGSALPVIRGMLGRPRPGTTAEVWFVTDNQQHAWRQSAPPAFLDGLPLPVKVRVVDVGVPAAQNAWIAQARLLELGRPARRVLRVELSCIGDTNQVRTLYLDATPGMPARSQEVTLTPGRTARIDFPVPAPATLDSGVLRFHLEPGDALSADDEFLLNLDTQGSLRVLLVEGPPTAVDPTPSGGNLRSAFEALTEVTGQRLRLTAVQAVAARPEDFHAVDAIFLADVPELSDNALAALEERVRGGTGVAIFLGGASKPAFLNERLYRPLAPAEGLLPAPVRPEVADDNRLAPLTSVLWSHPLLAGLSDPKVGDLGKVRFRRWYEFTRELDETSAVLARIDEGAPALLDRTLGSGRVVVVNTGANDRWSDLPRAGSFVPFIDRLLTQLSGSGLRRSFIVGEVVTLPLSSWRQSESVTVTTPGGSVVRSLRERRSARGASGLQSESGLLTFEADEAGVYQVERAEASFAVVVQPGRGDSMLAPMDSALLKQWWDPADCEVIRDADLDQHLNAGGGHHGLWPWLLLIGGLVLLAETYLVHRLCPRASPKLVQNLVAPRNLSHHSTSHG